MDQCLGQARFTQPRQPLTQPHEQHLDRAAIGHAFAFGTGTQTFERARFTASA